MFRMKIALASIVVDLNSGGSTVIHVIPAVCVYGTCRGIVDRVGCVGSGCGWTIGKDGLGRVGMVGWVWICG